MAIQELLIRAVVVIFCLSFFALYIIFTVFKSEVHSKNLDKPGFIIKPGKQKIKSYDWFSVLKHQWNYTVYADLLIYSSKCDYFIFKTSSWSLTPSQYDGYLSIALRIPAVGAPFFSKSIDQLAESKMIIDANLHEIIKQLADKLSRIGFDIRALGLADGYIVIITNSFYSSAKTEELIDFYESAVRY